MTRRGHIPAFVCVLALTAFPALAQPADDRITQLEQKLDTLLQQAAEIRAELQQIRGTSATAEPAPAAAAEPEDLTAIDVAEAPPATPPAAAAPAAPSLTDVQTVENQVSPGASKALNPDMSAVGNVLTHAGDNLEGRPPAEIGEVELALEAFIDPYAKGKFFLSIGHEGVDVEEGYAQFVALPWGLTAKAGKTKATFGKANTWHTHTRPWVDQPLMISRFFGDEGMADSGVSVSRTIENPWNTFVEATGEIYSGDVDGVFGPASDNYLFYNAHLKAFRDLTENSNLEVGTSWSRGTLPSGELTPAGHNQFTGIDVTYRWKPLSRSIYNSLVARFEGLANERAGIGDTLYGAYASLDYQLGQRWFTGVRLDRADALDGASTDRSLSALLTFRPSEFSQLRGQFRRTKLGIGPSFNELLLQLQFSIGAHGAHTF